MLFNSIENNTFRLHAYTFCDRRTEENVLPLRPNRIFGDGVPFAAYKKIWISKL